MNPNFDVLAAPYLDFNVFDAHLECGATEAALSLVTKENARSLDINGFGVMVSFCANGPDNPEMLRRLMDLGVPLHDKRTPTPIFEAVASNKTKLVRFLLDIGTHVDTRSNDGNTALDYALMLPVGKECVRLLLDAGANIQKLHNGIPQWAHEFIETRKKVRDAAIVVLGVLRCCGANAKMLCGNGKDVLCVIARGVWSTRGHHSETATQPPLKKTFTTSLE